MIPIVRSLQQIKLDSYSLEARDMLDGVALWSGHMVERALVKKTVQDTARLNQNDLAALITAIEPTTNNAVPVKLGSKLRYYELVNKDGTVSRDIGLICLNAIEGFYPFFSIMNPVPFPIEEL